MKISDHHSSIPERRMSHRERVLKSIGVLPSLATLGNLTCGLGAIYLCMLSVQATDLNVDMQALGRSKLIGLFPSFLSAAAYLLIVGMCFDAIDGRLARLARKTSEFGAQLDSLADVVSFGVAPALLVLCIAQPAVVSKMSVLPVWERAYWRAEWVMAAIFVCCAAMRLARFNVENEEDESAHIEFRGLPSPGAAGAIIGLVVLHQGLLQELVHPRTVRFIAVLMPPFALVLGLLMVSRFHYPHMINMVLRGRRPFWQVVSIGIVVLIALVVEFQLTLAIAAVVYALFGPVTTIAYKVLGKSKPGESLLTDIKPDSLEDQETFEEADEYEESDFDSDHLDHDDQSPSARSTG